MAPSINEIIEYVSDSKQVKELYRLAMDCGFWPDFPDYKIERFCEYLKVAEVEDLSEIDDLISRNFSSIERFIAEVYLHRKNGWNWRLNAIFLCELVLIYKFLNSLNFEYLIENGWDEDIAKIVLTAARNNA